MFWCFYVFIFLFFLFFLLCLVNEGGSTCSTAALASSIQNRAVGSIRRFSGVIRYVRSSSLERRGEKMQSVCQNQSIMILIVRKRRRKKHANELSLYLFVLENNIKIHAYLLHRCHLLFTHKIVKNSLKTWCFFRSLV